MNTLPRLLPSLPYCYQDGSFQVIMRDAESVAVFWDLPNEPSLNDLNVRLCLRIFELNTAGEVSAKAPEVLILHHEAGHAFVPMAAGCERYRFTLGWDDGTEFHQVAEDEVEMPVARAAVGQTVMTKAVEGCGFHPLAMAMAT